MRLTENLYEAPGQAQIVGADGGTPLPYPDAVEGSIQRVARLCNAVDPAVELGTHLCYGDPGHQHIVEPKDLGTSVAFANGIAAGSNRNIDYVHMAVPRDRSDDAYFQPLKDLKLPPTTKLILGLVRYTGGVEGGRKRIQAADKFATDYDIATECGFGRRDPRHHPGPPAYPPRALRIAAPRTGALLPHANVVRFKPEAAMINVDELIKGVPDEYQNRVYEKMQSMSETEQESFVTEMAAAIASSPEAQGTMEARAKEREAHESTTPKVGETAPDFDLATLDGNARVHLSALRGKPVGLIFGSYT